MEGKTGMQDRMRNVEEFARYATDMIVLMDEDQQRTNEALERLNEAVQQLRESSGRRDETLQRMLQAMAVIQADIVRIDQTHGGE